MEDTLIKCLQDFKQSNNWCVEDSIFILELITDFYSAQAGANMDTCFENKGELKKALKNYLESKL